MNSCSWRTADYGDVLTTKAAERKEIVGVESNRERQSEGFARVVRPEQRQREQEKEIASKLRVR